MSGYEHEHEHGHYMPHSHSHRHQGEQPTEAHERSGMGPHHHTHAALTRREPLDVEVLARAIGDSGAVRNIAWPPSWHNEATYAWLARSFAAEYARLSSSDTGETR